MSNDPPVENSSPVKEQKVRFVALDAFRGITILLMLLVNNVALDEATPAHLMHAPWNGGVRLADLVFPWFLLCMGVAVPFSMRSAAKKGLTGWRLAAKVVSRSAMLFLLGLLVDSAIQRQPFFGLGVLQLLALAYLFGSALYRLPMAARAVACGVLLLIYGLTLKFVTVPGMAEPMFEEHANVVKYINDVYLNASGLRGLPSVIPTAALVALGSILGEFLTSGRKWVMLWIAGAGLVVAGAGALWNLALPYNKPVWTPSYILLSAGLGAILIAILSLIFDHGKRRKLAFPLVVFGSNALLAYAGPILIKVLILQVWTIGPASARQTLQSAWLTSLKTEFGAYQGGLAYTSSYILLVWIALLICYRKGLFLRV